MQEKRTARSECVFSNVLDIFGDKWTFLVIRDLLFFNKHEYKEFLSSPEAIATNILSDRLKKLLLEGVIAEQAHPDNKSRKFYYLTEKGKDLLPLILEMARWGARHLPHLTRMQPLYARVKKNPSDLIEETLAAAAKWESQNLPARAASQPRTQRITRQPK